MRKQNLKLNRIVIISLIVMLSSCNIVKDEKHGITKELSVEIVDFFINCGKWNDSLLIPREIDGRIMVINYSVTDTYRFFIPDKKQFPEGEEFSEWGNHNGCYNYDLYDDDSNTVWRYRSEWMGVPFGEVPKIPEMLCRAK